MKLQHLRKVRSFYPEGGIWYVQFYPRASGYSTRTEVGPRPKSSVADEEVFGGRDIPIPRRFRLRHAFVATVGTLSIAFVATVYLFF